MDNLTILQVIGYKNSGKTTLISNWIKRLHAIGKQVSVIKHHGHENGLQLSNEDTDSMKFFQAGAATSIVADDDTILFHQQKKSPQLEDLTRLVNVEETDLLLIEGFKKGPYPKIVLVKNEEDWETLQHVNEIVCVVSHVPFQLENYPTFHIDDNHELFIWLQHYIGGDLYETI
ncbi:molybdopterin-guanine dinucleotide biosynthesis protein B [Lysinibacillus sp. BW-2-10]|uniref:molybdopterin-guanine dinucleotide biosynthesis protein B n=1 Tax=Lysinibacillus sp. BW-2-10 TaxID=2590030 RepID=UPI00117C7939|nr:molybdopterin-guanine dinucleotide biosynthesis protein B [Lysinibacillus sp. BW-2-10]TSI05196.1 molybdopterin-guanine dinucleotide biosynthesis protein B [Lysinibacillus sp. BW-2-10]